MQGNNIEGTMLKDKIFMSTMKKYELHGKFPWKLIIHLLLIILSTSQVLLTVHHSTQYSYNHYTLWNKLFLNREADSSDTEITNSYNIFSYTELKHFISTTINTYYNINTYSIDNYEYDYEEDGTRLSPNLLIKYYDNKKADNEGFSITYDLKVNDLGPFDLQDHERFLENVEKFEIFFKFRHEHDRITNLHSKCFVWHIRQVFDFKFHGAVQAKLDVEKLDCFSEDRNFFKNFFWVDVVVLGLALASVGLVGRHIYKGLRLLSEISNNRRYTVWTLWRSISIKEKKKFFNFWTIIVLMSNFLQIFGSMMSLINRTKTYNVYETLLGFSCFFTWIGLLRYLKLNSYTNTLVLITRSSFKPIFLYITGVVPIFMGYSFLAMCCFWQLGIYNTSPMALLANYAVVYGDSLYSFSLSAYGISPLLAQVYFYSYALFFISFVHKVFIAIIESNFSKVLHESKKGKNEEEIKSGFKSNTKSGINLIESLIQVKKKRPQIFEDKTLEAIQTMDTIIDLNIISKLIQIEKTLKSSPNHTILKNHFIEILNTKLFPVLSHFYN